MNKPPPWVCRWWEIANERRQRLIVQKFKGGGLTKAQELEFKMLQNVCGEVMEYVAPIDFGPLEKIVKKYEELGARIGKANVKTSGSH